MYGDFYGDIGCGHRGTLTLWVMITHGLLYVDRMWIPSGFELYYAHTNRFCVVQENIKPEVLKVQTELARSVH